MKFHSDYIRFKCSVYSSYNVLGVMFTVKLYATIGNPTVPEPATPPPSYSYEPNHCQVAYANLSVNRERNLGVLATIKFNKVEDHTVLRITWEVGYVMMM